MTGKKKIHYNDDVKVINLVQRKWLRASRIHLFARSNFYTDSYLPEYDCANKPNRCWLAKVINSLVGKFQKYIALIMKINT